MNNRSEIEHIQREFANACKQYEQLRHVSVQGNLSTKMAFDQCAPVLNSKKQNTERFLTKLTTKEPELDEYNLQSARKTLQEFIVALRDSEIKIRNARTMPPFLY
ncbi:MULTISPECIES: hypothetical protein [Methylotuvimicrobium]|uniref:Uncharacterized protein n=1 Tax=Methylotuvimicrobium buryatense TaxID=95641 RepID=A0A4P9UN99_METBY|nr:MULTISPECIES: hypothetical protein [Methylotuvimicrobium]QCW81953.1 hypothetical protein EQU24_06585 [Methylotuvimicrobium buryatense]